MSYQAWMPLQGTKAQQAMGKSYNYPNKKNTKTAKGTDKSGGLNSMWELAAESYKPSAAAIKYQASKSAGAKGETELSEGAKKLLAQLREKYSNMDFFVASYSSDEEAQSYLSRGRKEYSVLIDPETLEAMAKDADVRKQYEDVLDGVGDKFAQFKEELGDDADKVKSFGISIDNEGNVSYFAELDKLSESRQKQLESVKEKRAEEKSKEAKKAKKDEQEKLKERQLVKSDSLEGLLEMIRNYTSGNVMA